MVPPEKFHCIKLHIYAAYKDFWPQQSRYPILHMDLERWPVYKVYAFTAIVTSTISPYCLSTYMSPPLQRSSFQGLGAHVPTPPGSNIVIVCLISSG